MVLPSWDLLSGRPFSCIPESWPSPHCPEGLCSASGATLSKSRFWIWFLAALDTQLVCKKLTSLQLIRTIKLSQIYSFITGSLSLGSLAQTTAPSLQVSVGAKKGSVSWLILICCPQTSRTTWQLHLYHNPWKPNFLISCFKSHGFSET
jgi:hypothetical protein